MDTLECQVCGHIAFSTAPENCPICGAPKDKFKELANAVKQPTDAVNLTDAEKKHIPLVKITGNKIEVTVGAIIHPMLAEHHIMYADLYIDNKGITRVPLGPSPWMAQVELKSEPKAVAELNLAQGQELKVLANCNLHGRWVSTQKI